jgi:hypothetical protein
MEDRMLRQACIVLAISGLVLGLSERHGQAGWSDARSNLTLGAASPVISIKNQKNDDDDDDHHHKNKNSDDDSGLTDCTIQQSGGGGGCTAPLKYVCEKLKGGKKCCGCVVDKNAKPEVCQNYPLTTNFAAKIFSAQHPQWRTGASCSQTATALHCCCSTK